jgi:DNA-binding transcriptional LysR family regulator
MRAHLPAGAASAMFDWNDLQIFLAIARGGSLAAASRQLSVNHSTVFRRLNTFEETLGVRLFDRLPSGYSLTAEGESIRAEAESVETSVLAIERRVAGRDLAMVGDVRVTTPANFAREFLAPWLPELYQRYPGIRVEIAASDDDFDLARREADIALRATPSPPDWLVGRELTRIRWAAYASPEYLEVHGRPASAEALPAHQLIAADTAFMRLPAFAWLRDLVPDARIRAKAGDLVTMAALAEAGVGICLLPGNQFSTKLVRLFELDTRFDSGLWLLTHPDLRHVGRIKAVMDFLAEKLRADVRLRVEP